MRPFSLESARRIGTGGRRLAAGRLLRNADKPAEFCRPPIGAPSARRKNVQVGETGSELPPVPRVRRVLRKQAGIGLAELV